jgi:hypothetical protein
MYFFQNARQSWWQKPLVVYDGRVLPAELAILQLEKKSREDGVWINSRGTKTGAYDLVSVEGKFKTLRKQLPQECSSFLEDTYKYGDLAKGCPDLVIWDKTSIAFRFVEVKCPKWDRLSSEQIAFISHAQQRSIDTQIAEWLFKD